MKVDLGEDQSQMCAPAHAPVATDDGVRLDGVLADEPLHTPPQIELKQARAAARSLRRPLLVVGLAVILVVSPLLMNARPFSSSSQANARFDNSTGWAIQKYTVNVRPLESNLTS